MPQHAITLDALKGSSKLCAEGVNGGSTTTERSLAIILGKVLPILLSCLIDEL
jgi:hypothetical protein